MATPEMSPEPEFFQTVSRHTQALLRTGRTVTRWIPRQEFVGDDGDKIAFRAIDADIAGAGGCVRDVGLFSRERGDDNIPWQRTRIVHHLTDGRGPRTYPDHDAEVSCHMSISTSPNFMVSFTGGNRRLPQEIAIININMLDILEVQYVSTGKLHRLFRFNRQVDGETWVRDQHYVVYDHIPQACILGFIPADAFREIWEDKRAFEPSAKTLNWYDDLQPHNQLRDQSMYAIRPTYPPPPPRRSRTPPPPPPPPRGSAAVRPPATPTTNGKDITFTLRDIVLNSRNPGRKRHRSPSPEPARGAVGGGRGSPSKRVAQSVYPGPLDYHLRNAK